MSSYSPKIPCDLHLFCKPGGRFPHRCRRSRGGVLALQVARGMPLIAIVRVLSTALLPLTKRHVLGHAMLSKCKKNLFKLSTNACRRGGLTVHGNRLRRPLLSSKRLQEPCKMDGRASPSHASSIADVSRTDRWIERDP